MSTLEILLIVTLSLLILTWIVVFVAVWIIGRKIKNAVRGFFDAFKTITDLTAQIKELKRSITESKRDSGR
jgi:predicted tellurium resistance membrane protein TerC